MKSLKNLLRKIDIFGAPFNFKYKTKDKYSTPFGGLIILLFIILALTFGVYYFIPFLKRKNLSIIYYTMNIPKTEQIRLEDSEAKFAIGLTCDDKGRFKANEIFSLIFNYIIYSKNEKGEYNKNIEPLSSHKCKYEDFYNKYNHSFDYLGLKRYQCLDNYSHSLEGIYEDQVFSYYEFSLNAVNNTKEAFNNIEEYLKINDCKLQMVYRDITIDLSNYKEPIKPFLNDFFIQLNPTLFIKRNVFFMNQYLYDDDSILTVFDEGQTAKEVKTLFSRYEEYSLYLGLNREETKPLNYINYAKIYIRADIKKTEIIRTYQKLTEFYADASSLLIGLYEFLIIILSYLNNFYAESSVIKKLFIFKGINNKYFQISKKSIHINELLLGDRKCCSKNYKSNNIKFGLNNFNNNNTIENVHENKNNFNKEIILNKSYDSGQILKINKINKLKIISNDIYTDNDNSSENNSKNILKSSKLEADRNNKDLNKSIIKRLNTFGKKEKKIKINLSNQNDLLFNYNIFEIIISLLSPCCILGNLKVKNELNDKATNFLYDKLDIILYIRNMILFDIINEILLDENKNHIINFLSRPILTIDNKYDIERINIFYKNYNEEEFDKFCDIYSKLAKNPNKNTKIKKLIYLSREKLKKLM